MSLFDQDAWRVSRHPGTDVEWRDIRRAALETMLRTCVNDSPGMAVEKAVLIIDTFFSEKMWPAWANSDSTVIWSESHVERFLLEHFTFEFRRNAEMAIFAD